MKSENLTIKIWNLPNFASKNRLKLDELNLTLFFLNL